jgi:hypothetical protein
MGEDHCTVSGECSEDEVLTFTPDTGFVGSDTVTLHMLFAWVSAGTSPPALRIYLPMVTRESSDCLRHGECKATWLSNACRLSNE